MTAIDLMYARRRRLQLPEVAPKPAKAPRYSPMQRLAAAEAWASKGVIQEVVEASNWLHVPTDLVAQYGFQEASRTDTQHGPVVRYTNSRGDNLIIASRQDTRPVNQQAPYQDRLAGAASNWSTRWEHHSVDGVRSIGYDRFGLADHLRRNYGDQQ